MLFQHPIADGIDADQELITGMSRRFIAEETSPGLNIPAADGTIWRTVWPVWPKSMSRSAWRLDA
jgi:hypothetical protein